MSIGLDRNGRTSRREPPRANDHDARTVLVVNDSLNDNGSLRWALQLSELWLEAGWSIVYFTLKSRVRGKPPPIPEGLSLVYGDTQGSRYRKAMPKMLLRAIRAAAASDVVLVCSEVPLSLPFAFLTSRVARRPFVVYIQSIPEHSQKIHVPGLLRPIWRHCLVHADAVLCVSPASARSAERLGVQPARITVARTGVDVEAIQRRGLDERASTAPGDEDTPRLVACGELHPHKGYDILVRALATVKRTGRRVRMVLIGRGPELPALVRLASDLDVSDAILFRGHVEDPLPEIASSDGFVHSGRVEAVGLVLLEALALGVPTIAADCEAGGPRMVLAGGRLGRLVEPESVTALADAICAHLDDPADLTGKARDGAAYLSEHFAPARTAAICREVMTNVSLANASLADPRRNIPAQR
jgi:glycosyltransferase involved in cell wall biosynthesis